jgi:hypothetical protein
MYTIYYVPANTKSNIGKFIIPKDRDSRGNVVAVGLQDFTRFLWATICKKKEYKGTPIQEARLLVGGRIVNEDTVDNYRVIEALDKTGNVRVIETPEPIEIWDGKQATTPQVITEPDAIEVSDDTPDDVDDNGDDQSGEDANTSNVEVKESASDDIEDEDDVDEEDNVDDDDEASDSSESNNDEKIAESTDTN